MKNVEVLKFGGASWGTKDQMREGFENNIWPFIEEKLKLGKKLVIVTSAPKGMTRELMIESIIDSKNAEKSAETDAILSQGEALSVKTLEKLLRGKKLSVSSFANHEVPFVTDASFGDAKVLYTDKESIVKKISSYDIVISPGYIGKDTERRQTTLGMDGSDISAVLFAKELNCSVTLFKDVLGICTANPSNVPKAVLIKELNTEDALFLAMFGSNIVHERALSIAFDFYIDIKIRPNFEHGEGTLISRQIPHANIAGITYKKLPTGSVKISIVGNCISKGCLDDLHLVSKTYNDDAFSRVYSIITGKSSYKETLRYVHTFYGLDAE